MTTTRPVYWLFITLIIFICAARFIFINPASNKSVRHGGVAYVSYNKVLEESTILAQENLHNEKVIAQANVAIKRTLVKSYDMPELIRREIRMIEKINKTNKLRAEQGRVRRISLKVISDEIEKYRLENHYSIIFNKDLSPPYNLDLDISNEIIEKLKGITVEYGNIPKFDETPLAQYN